MEEVPEYVVHWREFEEYVISHPTGQHALCVPWLACVWAHISLTFPCSLCLISLARSYGLRLLYKAEFHHVFEQHRDHPEFGPLLEKMKVVDSNGESHMDEDQWEAASTSILHSKIWSWLCVAIANLRLVSA